MSDSISNEYLTIKVLEDGEKADGEMSKADVSSGVLRNIGNNGVIENFQKRYRCSTLNNALIF